MKGNTMNVPKTPDYKLIGALGVLANDANTEEGLLEAVLYEAADRLAELTQAQPIETAPRDGTKVRCFGFTFNWDGKPRLYDWNLAYKQGCWVDPERRDTDIPQPTHWMPHVQVDIDALKGGRGDE